jgi:hypothetical protein
MSAQTTVTKKDLERAYVGLARRWYAAFPLGALEEGKPPAPDFLTAPGSFGVEVTQLFQPPLDSRFPPRQIESFREGVIRRAEEIYSGSGSPPVGVNAYFSVHPVEKRPREQLAQVFAEFVCGSYPDNGKVLNFRESDPGSTLPPGFGAVSVAPPLPGRSPRWFAGHVGETKLLTYDLIAERITAKNPLVGGYRACVSTVWLLIVIDIFPFSSSFSVPADVDTWHFDHEFDQVLLLSRQASKVWALSR